MPDVRQVVSWNGDGWQDLDAIAAALAASEPAWSPGTQRGYHAVTYGWLVGELVRRTDGRTLGRFFRDEVAQPLGIRAAVGVPAQEQSDIAIVHPDGMDTPPLLMRRINGRMRRLMRDPSTLLGKASLGDGKQSIFDDSSTLVNSSAWNGAEVPSSNGVSSAHDLARLFAAVACGGELDGVRLVSPDTLERFTASQPTSQDVVFSSAMGSIMGGLMRRKLTAPISLSFALNGAAGTMGPNPRAFGAGGYGGQFVLADPDRRLSIAFVRSALLPSQRELTALVRAVYADLDSQQ